MDENNKIIPPKLVDIIVMVILYMCLLVSMIVGSRSSSYRDFAIDEEGNLYIGKYGFGNGVICVYSADGTFMRKIKFTVGKVFIIDIRDNNLIVTDEDSTLIMDFDGNILDETEGVGEEKLYEMIGETNKFTAPDGKTYTFKDLFGYHVITNEDGAKVYSTPIIEYIAKILCIMLFVVLFIKFFTFVMKNKKYFLNRPNPWK